jgi:hypothetical protein
MLGDLVNNRYSYRLFLCNGREDVIGEINYSELQVSPRFAASSEISFKVNLYDDYNLTQNYLYDSIKGSMLVLMNIYIDDSLEKQDLFYIDNLTTNSSGIISKNVHCFSYDYAIFAKKKLRAFTQVRRLYDSVNNWDADDNTKGGILNYICEILLKSTFTVSLSASVENNYASYDISDSTVKATFEQIQKDNNAFIIIDNINKVIQVYDKSEFSNSSGIYLDESNYIVNLSDQNKHDEIVTRLHVEGESGDSINRYNITGMGYIDDFSYYRNNGYWSSSLETAYDSYVSLLSSYEGIITRLPYLPSLQKPILYLIISS